jgi:peptidoglycan endopeptidase LytE
MNEHTQLNSELLSADARGRKHIPVAVFAVILIHVVLFLVLLIAAGCRSSLRAKQNATPPPVVADTLPTHGVQQSSSAPYADPAAQVIQEAPISTTPPAALPQTIRESVIATEEVITPRETAPVTEVHRAVTQQTPAARQNSVRSSSKIATPKKNQMYVVKSGDTLGKIAKLHGVTVEAVRTANKLKGDLIFPGQKLQLSPVNAAQAQPRKKRSNEV